MNLFWVLFLGFVAGAVLPPVGSRFGKLIPADPGTILMHLWHRPRFPKGITPEWAELLRLYWIKMAVFMVFWGVLTAGFWGLIYTGMPVSMSVWAYVFVWIVGVLIVIDQQYFLLPDFFTIPLLLLGFGMAAYTDTITVTDSFWGACFGYGVSTASVMLMSLFKRAEFGGGDFKMMTALGAWLGVMGLNYTIILSFIFFAVPAIIKKNRVGAYGPALGFAALVIFFWFYLK